MEAADVIAVPRVLADADVESCVNGGWGVDALAGKQTRPHEDLDLVIGVDDVQRAIDALNGVGFAIDEDQRPISFAMCTPDGRKVDVHPVTWDQHGDGVQAQPNNSTWTYAAAAFRGVGRIDGQPVRCLTAEVQILCHADYELDAGDRHDLEVLRSLTSQSP
jgi:lincosamide nucleotidyltransferase A/C/D/E